MTIKRNITTRTAALCGLMVATMSMALQAQVATYEFTGTVQPSQVPEGNLGGFNSPLSPYPGLTAQVGDPVTGSFSFSRLPDMDGFASNPDILLFPDVKASIEIHVNGHRVTTYSWLMVMASNNDASYGGSDLFLIQSPPTFSLQNNGEPVLLPDSEFLQSAILFIDQTETARTNQDLPESFDLGDWNVAVGMIRHTDAAGSAQGIEFSLDSIQRVYDLRIGRFVAWPDDSPLSLEVSDQAQGPYLPYLGEVNTMAGEQFVEMDATGAEQYYRLAEPPPVGIGPEDFDDLPVGTAPDVGTPVGTWQFPEGYVTNDSVETDASQFSIVPTSGFDPGALGNSLQVSVNEPRPVLGYHLPSLMIVPLHESNTERVLARFDILVPQGAGAGCAIYVGGDHGGGGWDNNRDRGPQIVFAAGDQLTAYQGSAGTRDFSYTRGAWQTVELDINLRTDTYALSIGPRGGALVELANDLLFRSTTLEFIDRFTVAIFSDLDSQWLAYLDNVSVKPAP